MPGIRFNAFAAGLRLERFYQRYRRIRLFALRLGLIQRIDVAHAGLSQLVIV